MSGYQNIQEWQNKPRKISEEKSLSFSSLKASRFFKLGKDDLNLDQVIQGIKDKKFISLDLKEADLTKDDKRKLFSALSGDETLQAINLSATEMDDEDATFLAKNLKGNKTLKDLNLSSNNIGSIGALAILSADTAIESIFLRWNKIDDSFSKAFKESPVHEIDFVQNRITDEGANLLLKNERFPRNALWSLLIGNLVNEKSLINRIEKASSITKTDISPSV